MPDSQKVQLDHLPADIQMVINAGLLHGRMPTSLPSVTCHCRVWLGTGIADLETVSDSIDAASRTQLRSRAVAEHHGLKHSIPSRGLQSPAVCLYRCVVALLLERLVTGLHTRRTF